MQALLRPLLLSVKRCRRGLPRRADARCSRMRAAEMLSLDTRDADSCLRCDAASDGYAA